MSTLVLIHAFPLDSRMYDEVASLVAETGWQVLLPDLRGCGGASDFDGEPSLDVCVDDIVSSLDRVGVDKAVVGGTSLGGYVTMAMLRRAPERVAGAIFIDTKASADSEEGKANRARSAEQVTRTGSTEALWRAMLPNALGQTTTASRPAVVDQTAAIMRDSRPEGVANLLLAMAARPDSHAAIAAARIPMLSIRGDEDGIASAADHEAIVSAGSDIRHVTIPGCGHLAPLEAPAETAAAIIDFLKVVQSPTCS